MLGISGGAVSHYYHGRLDWPLDKVAKIANIFGIHPAELFVEHDEELSDSSNSRPTGIRTLNQRIKSPMLYR